MRVAAYCRVSTEEEEQLSSLKSQREFFQSYISNHPDWELVKVYYDEGVSGTSTQHRNGFNNMIEDAALNLIDLIITKEVSRFARNTVDTLSITRELKKQGIGVVFVNDNINTLDSDGELRLSIMATIAQEESRKTSERVKWGHKRCMERGVVFGRSMLGYDVRGGKLYINEEEAEIVRLIFHKYVNENKGTHVIARELLEAGIRPMRVKHWSNTVILRLLRNEKYVGDLCQQKTYTPSYLDHKKKANKGEVEQVYIKDHHEPIVKRELWDKAQDILAARTLTDEQKSRHSCRYPFSGKIICGECGKKYVSRTKALSDGSRYKAWRCGETAAHGRRKQAPNGEIVGCNNISVNDKVLREGVLFTLKLLKLNKEEIIAEMTNELKSVMGKEQCLNTDKFKADIEEIQKKKNRLLDLHLSGDIRLSDYKSMAQEYDMKIDENKAEIMRIENICSNEKRVAAKMSECIKKVSEYLDFENAHEILCGEVTESIRVFSDRVLEIKLKYVPPIKLKFTAHGKMENYNAEFELI